MSLWDRCRRRGVVVVQTAVLSTVLFGFAALAIDMGRLYAVKAEAQRAADAAAFAGVSGLATDGMLAHSDANVLIVAQSRATDIASANTVFNAPPHLAAQDIEFGTIADPDDPNSSFVPCSPSSANAVRVTIRRSTGSTDGPIPMTFGRIFGRQTGSVVATATAVLNSRFAGFQPPPDGGGLLMPFTIQRTQYNQQLTGGSDDYGYADGSVRPLGDGVPELILYPDKQGGGDGNGNGNGGGNSNGGDGSGNFGILNVANPNNGVPAIEAQILNGITPDNLAAEIGAPDIRFVDDNGHAISHQIGGDPGLKAGLKDALASRIGDVVGFFIHTTVTGNGANAEFTIADMRFGRVMAVDLNGSGGKGLVIQPVAYESSGVITTSEAASAGPYVSRIQLAR